MMRIRRALLVAFVTVGLAACGSGGGNTVNPAPSSAISDAELLGLGKQVAECIRNNGIPDFPDPYVDRGKLKLPEDADQNLEQKYSQQVMDQAEQSCRALMDRIPEAALKGDDQADSEPEHRQPGPGDIEALKKFAQCMRDNGFPDWPDPKADGSFPIQGTQFEAEGKSERFITAAKECEKYWNGGFKAS